MLTLYQRSDCPFCWKVRIALAFLGMDYTVVDSQLGEKHPLVQQLSPTSTVPVLTDDDLAIWESSVILEYLDAQYSRGRLLPEVPALAARVRLLQAYSDKLVGPALRDLVFEKRSKPESQWNREVVAKGEKQWQQCQLYLEQALVGNAFFGGDRMSAADCALAARCGVAEAYGAGISPEFVGLQLWYRQIQRKNWWLQAYPKVFLRTV